MAFCVRCGKEVSGDGICRTCGANNAAPGYTPAAAPQMAPIPPAPTGKKGRGLKILLGVVLGFVGLFILSIMTGAFYIMKHKKPVDSSEENRMTVAVALAGMSLSDLNSHIKNPNHQITYDSVLLMKDSTICLKFKMPDGLGFNKFEHGVILPDGTMKNSLQAGFAPLWSKGCANRIGTDLTEATMTTYHRVKD